MLIISDRFSKPPFYFAVGAEWTHYLALCVECDNVVYHTDWFTTPNNWIKAPKHRYGFLCPGCKEN